MTLRCVRARALSMSLGLAALGVAMSASAFDVTWIGAEGGNWTTVSNWENLNTSGLPLRDFGEVAVINNNTTAIVNSSIPDAAAGLTLGTAAGNIGRLTVQNGGLLEIEPGDVFFGLANIGVAGKGTLTVLGGGNLKTHNLTVAGETTGGTQSEVALGDTSGLTATYTVVGNSSLGRTTRIVGPNVNFTTQGQLTLGTAGTLVADIRHASNHSAIKATGTAQIGGTLRPQFTGVTPALGNTWNLVDASSIVGSFATIDSSAAPALPADQRYQARRIAGGTNGQLMQLTVEQMLTLQVNRNTGAVTIRNSGAAVAAASVSIDGYSVISANGSLNTTNARWNSLTDQAVAGWTEGTSGANSLNELNMASSTAIAGNTTRALGTPYTATFPVFGADPDDITFQYTTAAGVRTGIVEYSGTKTFNNLLLTVNPATGQAQLKNDSPHTIQLEGYSIFSPTNALKPANGQWNSLADQLVPGIIEAAPTTGVLSELVPTGTVTLTGGQAYNLGTPFTVGGAQTLSLEFLINGEANNRVGQVVYGTISTGFAADFNNSGTVTGADLTVWRSAFGANTNGNADGDADSDGNDFLIWQRQLGSGLSTGATSAVPEPAALGLALCGLAAAASLRTRRRAPAAISTNTCSRSQTMRRHGMWVQGSWVRRTAIAGLAACSVLTASSAWAVNIAWLSLHNSDGSASAPAAADPFLFTSAPDIGYTNALTAAGHTVTRFTLFDNVDASTLAADLNAPGIDLVIVGRSADSGFFQSDAETLVWNSTVAKPMIVMSAFVARGARLGLTRNINDDTPDTPATAVKLEAVVPSHPIFAGVSLDANNVMVNNYNLDVTAIQQVATVNQRSFNTVMHPMNGGGQILARIATAGATQNGLVIGVTPAGSVVQNVNTDGDDVLAAARMVFYSGTREHAAVTTPTAIPTSTHVSGIYDLATDGGKLFLNAVNYMAATSILKPGDVDGDGDVDVADFNVIKTNFRTTVTLRNQGDLTGDGFVDLADFRLWKDNDPLFGAAAAGGVPEPTGLALAWMGVTAALVKRRRRTAIAHATDKSETESMQSESRTRARGRAASRIVVLTAMTLLVSARQVQAADIAWLSFHTADSDPSAAIDALGITEAPDIGYTTVLTGAGHTVTRIVAPANAQDVVGLGAQLNGFDLVIHSRSIASGLYDTDAEVAFWNGLTAPHMIMSGYLLRNVRMGYTSGGTIPDTAGPIKLTAAAPAHPVWAGIALDGNLQMVNDYTSGLPLFNGGTQRGISVNTDPLTGGGTLIARDSTPGDPGNSGTGMIIAEWQAGAVLPNTAGGALPSTTLGGKRMVFLSGGRETNGVTSESAGVFDLTATGQQMFLNAVNYLTAVPGDVDGDGDVDMADFTPIRDNFQKSVTMRSQGDLNGDGMVDWIDFRQWKTNEPLFSGGASGSVPEPTSACLGLMVAAALGGARRMSRRGART